VSWSSIASATLENAHVQLRPLAATDRTALAAVAFDPDIWRYFVTRVDDASGLDRFMQAGLDDAAAGRRAVYVVIDKQSSKVAGSMCFGNLAEADRRIEIGWSWLGHAFRGTGVNRWAKLALLTAAFETLGCERVEFKTDVLNERAKRGLRKIGATEEGVLRSFNFMPDGRRRDAVYFSVLRAEWPAVRQRLTAADPALLVQAH